MIDINEGLFLTDFDKFRKVLLPLYEKERKADGLEPFTEDEITNLFIDLRNKYGLKGNGEGTRETA